MREGRMPGRKKNVRRSRRKKDGPASNHNRRTKSLMLLQQDLFVMTCTTVFRNLEEEGLFDHTADFQRIRDRFNAKQLYEKALHDDIPWRQWSHWVRQKIIEHLKQAGAGPSPAEV